MKRHIWLGAAMTAALVRPAMADDLAISSKTTTAVATSSPANGSPGNITIATGGSVEVSASSIAVTLDSNNSVVNNGLIFNSTGNTSTGVNILTGNTGSFLNNGNITVAPEGNTTMASTGLLLNGTGSFTGNISFGNGSLISVTQQDSVAVALHSNLDGNLTNRGTILGTGVGAKALSATHNISGIFANYGNITVSGGGTSTTSLNATSGTGVSIGGSIGGGFLNAGPVNSSDSTPAASINQSGTSPALQISPSIGGNVGDIGIGILNDAGNPGYSFINRGRISSIGTQPATSTLGMQIGNNAGDAGYNTVLAGGIYNSGSIAAAATSGNANATAVSPSASNATAVIIGASAKVPVFRNAASGTITATTDGPLGGTATAIQLVSNASMSTLNNAGIISASANATSTSSTSLMAIAITDLSGSLLNIDNSGTISATGRINDNDAQPGTAINLGSSNLPATITNSGTIVGDIVFGTSTNNQLTIDGSKASVTGQVQTASPGRVSIAISQSGTGGVLTTSGNIHANSLTVGANGALNLSIGTTEESDGIRATGPVTFDAASRLTITPASLLPKDSTVTLIHSDTSLSFGNYSATTQGFSIPFLFTGNLNVDSKTLTLNLRRKTASDLGLTGDAATIFEPAMAAAANDADWGAELSKLTSASAVQSTIGQLAPVVSNATTSVAKKAVDTASNTIAARQKALMLVPDVEGGRGVWAGALYDRYNDTSAAGYNGNGKGFALGFDYSEKQKGHFGIALAIYNADTIETGARTASEQSHWVLLQPYVGLRNENFFINFQMEIGFGETNTKRAMQAGSLLREANGTMKQLLASGGLTSGYILSLGPVRFVPEINLSGLQLLQDSYTETSGGNGAALAIKERSLFSIRGTVGATVNADVEAFGGHIVPQLFGGWSQEIKSPNNAVNAAFASVAGSDFTLRGPRESRSRLIGSAGLYYVMNNWSVGLAYDANFQSMAHVQGGRVTVAGRF